jgi:hypothetical protein
MRLVLEAMQSKVQHMSVLRSKCQFGEDDEEARSNHTILAAIVKEYFSLFSCIFWHDDDVSISTTAAGSLERPLTAHFGRAYDIKDCRRGIQCLSEYGHWSKLRICWNGSALRSFLAKACLGGK